MALDRPAGAAALAITELNTLALVLFGSGLLQSWGS
jgi:hypothetical protein